MVPDEPAPTSKILGRDSWDPRNTCTAPTRLTKKPLNGIAGVDRVTILPGKTYLRDMLGGVTVVKGKFTDSTPMLAIPNYAHMNREPVPGNPAAAGAFPDPRNRRSVPPPVSSVWIKEA